MVKWSGGRGKLLGMQETGCKYEKMAEVLPGRSVGAVRGKLERLKREKREDTYIGGRGSAHTERSSFYLLDFGGKINRINVQYI